jgi:hypothetical protein
MYFFQCLSAIGSGSVWNFSVVRPVLPSDKEGKFSAREAHLTLLYLSGKRGLTPAHNSKLTHCPTTAGIYFHRITGDAYGIQTGISIGTIPLA